MTKKDRVVEALFTFYVRIRSKDGVFIYVRYPTHIRGRSQLSTFIFSYRAYGGGGGHEASVQIFKC